MRRIEVVKETVKEIYLDLEGNQYERTYFISDRLCHGSGSWYVREIAHTEEEALQKAKAYVHISQVKIEVTYKRIIDTLPQIPVCT